MPFYIQFFSSPFSFSSFSAHPTYVIVPDYTLLLPLCALCCGQKETCSVLAHDTQAWKAVVTHISTCS
jgi:hypothetical protein